MSGDESVGNALRRVRKARQAAELSQSAKAVRAPGEQLMNIALMADVKNEPVFFCVEHTLNRERQLHNAKIRRQMPAGLADMTNQKIADLPAELRLLCVGQRQKIRSGVNFL